MQSTTKELPPFTEADHVVVEKKPEEQPQAPQTQQQKMVVELNKFGVPVPSNIDEAFRLATAMWQGKSFPAWVKTPIQALAVSQFCRSLGLDPMVGIQHTCEVNGRISLWGEGPLAAVRSSGKLEWIEEIFLDKEYKEITMANKNLDAELFAAVCRVKRIGSSKPVERSFTNKDEQTAMKGLANIWKGYKRIMYKRKARAEALKDEFGDVLGGAGIAEYDFHSAPDSQLHGGEKQITAKERLELSYGKGPEVQEASQRDAVPFVSNGRTENKD